MDTSRVNVLLPELYLTEDQHSSPTGAESDKVFAWRQALLGHRTATAIGSSRLPWPCRGTSDVMAKAGTTFYAVARGRKTGVYKTWSECQAQTDGFAAARYKKFTNVKDAEKFIEQMVDGWPGRKNESKDVTTLKRQNASDEDLMQGQKKRKIETADDEGSSESKDPRVRIIEVFTDGASSSNGQAAARAGWGVHFPEGVADKDSDLHGLEESARLPGKQQTNNRAELMAIIRAIQLCPDPDAQLHIYSDSKYCIQAMDEWVTGWRKKRWMRSQSEPVKNRDMIRLLDKLLRERRRRPRLIYVKGHSKNEGNNEADRLAVAGAKLPDVPEDQCKDLEPEASDVETSAGEMKSASLARFGFVSTSRKT